MPAMNRNELIELMKEALQRTYPASSGNQVRAILTTIDQAGFVVVPREPTEAMEKARHQRNLAVIRGEGWSQGEYEVMIAAALQEKVR